MNGPVDINAIGAHDLTYYYLAFTAWREGLNPYDPAALQRAAVVAFGPAFQLPGYYHFIYPPFLLIILAPILLLPFSLAVNALLLLSFLSLFCIPILIGRYLSTQGEFSLRSVACLALFPPAFECLRWGQLGLFLALALTLIVGALRTNRNFLAGLLAVFLLLKPQLFLVFFLWLFMRGVSFGSPALLLGLWAGAFAVSGLLFLNTPELFTWWAQSAFFAQHDWEQLQGASISHALRSLLMQWSGKSFRFLPAALTICGVVASGALFWWRRNLLELRWLPIVICLSLILSPYCWFHDHSILLVAFAAVLAQYSGGEKAAPLGVFLLLQLSTLSAAALFFSHQGQYFWYPLAALCFCGWVLFSQASSVAGTPD